MPSIPSVVSLLLSLWCARLSIEFRTPWFTPFIVFLVGFELRSSHETTVVRFHGLGHCCLKRDAQSFYICSIPWPRPLLLACSVKRGKHFALHGLASGSKRGANILRYMPLLPGVLCFLPGGQYGPTGQILVGTGI